MFIERNGEKIELTPVEINKAYREQEHAYKLEDAEMHLYSEIIGTYPDAYYKHPELFSNYGQDFINTYGFSINEACNNASKHFILDDIVYEYEDKFDCEVGENTIWQYAIENVLARLH